ncbi:hypothetical protein B7C42_08064 [Nocardia cerradoensis]|uniref:55.5 kDa and 49.5 kDa sporulation protein n=1 Tax=Nocardia cerradoensis TaxID=85688 RepID=A0A231GTB5_9NOCA|nr:hypothetical protein B7C42_08064 [Nocardia cerradoensis]
MKREAFAAHTGVSVEAVRKWERRRETIVLSVPYAARMDRKLREAEAFVVERFWSLLAGRDASGAARSEGERAPELEGADHMFVPAHTASGEVVLMSIPRRTFMAGVGVGAVGVVVDRAVSGIPLAEAFAGSDIDHAKFFLDKRMNIIEADNVYGSASTLAEVLDAIARMQALRQAKVVDSQRVLRLLALYAETAAWQYQDQRMFEQAQHWAEKALTWAHQLGDDYCIGMSLVRMSQLASDRGDGASSGELAEAAKRAAPECSLFAAAAVAYGAHALSLEKNAAASARAYDDARLLIEKADADPVWGFFLDHSYIDAYQAHSLVALGDHHAAAAQFDAATARMQSGYPRDRGVYLARAAVAHMTAGDIEPAASAGKQALRIGIATNSGRIMEPVITLAALMDPHSTQPGVGEFVEEFEQWKVASCPSRM